MPRTGGPLTGVPPAGGLLTGGPHRARVSIGPMATPLTTAELGVMKDFVVPLAYEVGRWARQQQVDHHAGRSDLGVSSKTSPGDVVTLVDLESQKRLAQALKQAYPAFGLLGEEGLAEFDSEAPVWVIDPIDGTHNFVRDYPGFCVSIGLVQGGESALGVIYDSASDEVYWAYEGGGAWRGQERLTLGEDRPLSHALISTNFTEAMRDDAAQQEFFVRTSGASAGVRASGSAARDLCFVADGRVDLFWQFGLRAWDVAAGAVIVREAGGVFQLWFGGGDWLRAPQLSVAAGTPGVMGQVSKLAGGLGLVDGYLEI